MRFYEQVHSMGDQIFWGIWILVDDCWIVLSYHLIAKKEKYNKLIMNGLRVTITKINIQNINLNQYSPKQHIYCEVRDFSLEKDGDKIFHFARTLVRFLVLQGLWRDFSFYKDNDEISRFTRIVTKFPSFQGLRRDFSFHKGSISFVDNFNLYKFFVSY